MKRIITEQKILCKKHKVKWTPTYPNLMVSVSANLCNNELLPINGLRHPLSGNSTGWYIWAGEDFSVDDVNFFQPMHAEHLELVCPLALKFLGLPPGWRFLADGKHEDVWHDKFLLNI